MFLLLLATAFLVSQVEGHVRSPELDYETVTKPSAAKASSGGFWETQLAPKAVDVPFGNSHLAVWEHLTRPGTFYVSPLVILLPDSIKFRRNILTGGSKITLDILMWSDEARDAVYHRLEGDQKGLQKEDISLLPMDKIRLVWRGSEDLDKSVLELPDTWMSNTHKQRIVSFDLTCWNKTACLEIIEVVREAPELLSGIELEYIASAQRASKKHVAVSGTQFMSSSLFAKLANMPGALGSVRYVNSNDLKMIASQVASNIVATVISDYDYEAQADEVSVTEIIEDFLGQHRISTKEFDETKWDSVFWNPEFARPDKVTSILNDSLEKNSTDADKISLSESTESSDIGLGESLDLIGLKGGQSSFTKANINEKLDNFYERKSHVEYNGLAFVLKPMVLYRVNLALFNTTNSVAFTDVKLFPNERTALIRVNVDYMKHGGKEVRSLEMIHIHNRMDNLEEKLGLIEDQLEDMFNETALNVAKLSANVKDYSTQFEDLRDSLTFDDCTSIKEADPLAVDGVYNLSLPRVGHVEAFCHMDEQGKGWTVLLRRSDHMNPHIDFDKDFDQFTLGFGNVSAEHWLGLEAMHALTSDKYLGRKKVRFELKDHNGKEYWAEYKDFEIRDRGDNYRLLVGKKAGGTAPDYFGQHNDAGFTTHDVDNDSNPSNCGHIYRSGWWFRTCHHVLLTGTHGSEGKKATNGHTLGIRWHGISNANTATSLTYVEMMVS